MFTEQRKTMCGQCPFARSTDKEYLDTRGQNGPRFVGQGAMNALLPCHMESENGNATVGEGRQCAGAAKYRANNGYQLHPKLGSLPQDHENAFSSPEELLAQHMDITVEEARQKLDKDLGGVRSLMQVEMARASSANRVHAVARK